MSIVDRRGESRIEDRQYWMSILSKADPRQLQKIWENTDAKPDFIHLRQPETGLIMVRARAGGTGQRFNFGEMTVTRCTVVLKDGTQGFGYVAGTDRRHAELAAVFDAMMLSSEDREPLEEWLLAPLAKAYTERRQTESAKSAATKVDFFTVVRGEGPK